MISAAEFLKWAYVFKLLPSSGSVTPAALTKTDDTNVTLTLGGTPATALLQAASITAGWTGTLGISRGGTALSTTPTNGQILIGNGVNYTLATLAAGGGITVTNSAGAINIAMTQNVYAISSIMARGIF